MEPTCRQKFVLTVNDLKLPLGSRSRMMAANRRFASLDAARSPGESRGVDRA
jgi:hypothetical protein